MTGIYTPPGPYDPSRRYRKAETAVIRSDTMTRGNCPGQDTRNWKPGDIFTVVCPSCGGTVEFFKDDVSRTCRCTNRVENPRLAAGCARWCDHAEQCLGRVSETAGTAGPTPPFRDEFVTAMIGQFGDDTRRINHALAVFDHAEEIRKIEGGDALVVTAAALLHDIGIQEAERIYGSPAPRYQEQLGPPIARFIMEGLAIDGATIEHVARIVGSHHSAGDIDTVEFRIIWDADALVNLRDEGPPRSRERWEKTIKKVFKTEAGKNRAIRIFIGE
jgi:hypothetical protein